MTALLRSIYLKGAAFKLTLNTYKEEKMDPFANESDSTEIGDLCVENRVDRISLYGTLTLTRDKAGLALAKELLELLAVTIQVLENDESLPEKIQEVTQKKVKNPFLK